MFKAFLFIFVILANEIDKDIISNLDFYLTLPILEEDEVMGVEDLDQVEKLIEEVEK